MIIKYIHPRPLLGSFIITIPTPFCNTGSMSIQHNVHTSSTADVHGVVVVGEEGEEEQIEKWDGGGTG